MEVRTGRTTTNPITLLPPQNGNHDAANRQLKVPSSPKFRTLRYGIMSQQLLSHTNPVPAILDLTLQTGSAHDTPFGTPT